MHQSLMPCYWCQFHALALKRRNWAHHLLLEEIKSTLHEAPILRITSFHCTKCRVIACIKMKPHAANVFQWPASFERIKRKISSGTKDDVKYMKGLPCLSVQLTFLVPRQRFSCRGSGDNIHSCLLPGFQRWWESFNTLCTEEDHCASKSTQPVQSATFLCLARPIHRCSVFIWTGKRFSCSEKELKGNSALFNKNSSHSLFFICVQYSSSRAELFVPRFSVSHLSLLQQWFVPQASRVLRTYLSPKEVFLIVVNVLWSCPQAKENLDLP